LTNRQYDDKLKSSTKGETKMEQHQIKVTDGLIIKKIGIFAKDEETARTKIQKLLGEGWKLV
jgi:hypothetical protein